MNLKDLHGMQRDACDKIVSEKMRLTERCLVGAVEQIEGRVPTNAEVVEHGRRLIHPDGLETFTWKGQMIVEIPRDALTIQDGKATLEIRSVFKE